MTPFDLSAHAYNAESFAPIRAEGHERTGGGGEQGLSGYGSYMHSANKANCGVRKTKVDCVYGR